MRGKTLRYCSIGKEAAMNNLERRLAKLEIPQGFATHPAVALVPSGSTEEEIRAICREATGGDPDRRVIVVEMVSLSRDRERE